MSTPKRLGALAFAALERLLVELRNAEIPMHGSNGTEPDAIETIIRNVVTGLLHCFLPAARA